MMVDDEVPCGVVERLGAIECEVAPVEGEPELPHAASRAAAPATIGAAHHRLRIATSPSLVICLKPSYPDYVGWAPNVQSIFSGARPGSAMRWQSHASDIG